MSDNGWWDPCASVSGCGFSSFPVPFFGNFLKSYIRVACMFCTFQETKDTVEHEERIEDINFGIYPGTLILQI